jgi:23S rRNA (cytidine1920-2'-O)/16S rRNA (cytidine1409-2'-O)-methyltransferase
VQAADAIAAGRVTVAGAPATKVSRLVAPAEPIELTGPAPRFVSRGGDKLDGALGEFGIDVTGMRALDAGASTGGFTDCLLQRGAARVVAVDVGHGQLHERLVRDDRVDQRNRTNVRNLDADAIGGPVDIVVADLSFISLRVVAPALVACARPGASLVLLVKPQFEASRQEAAKAKGVIRDDTVRERVLDEILGAVAGLGAAIMGTMVSPLTGADGNVEYFVHARKP